MELVFYLPSLLKKATRATAKIERNIMSGRKRERERGGGGKRGYEYVTRVHRIRSMSSNFRPIYVPSLES